MEMSTPSGEEIYSTPHEEISKPCSSPINAVNRAARALVLWNTHCNHAAAARAALCVLNSVSHNPAATVGRQVVHVHA